MMGYGYKLKNGTYIGTSAAEYGRAAEKALRPPEAAKDMDEQFLRYAGILIPKGRNLVDNSRIQYGFDLDAAGNVIQCSQNNNNPQKYAVLDYIPVEPETSYHLRHEANFEYGIYPPRYAELDADGNVVNITVFEGQSTMLTTTESTRYLRLPWVDEHTERSESKILLARSDVPVDYQDYEGLTLNPKWLPEQSEPCGPGEVTYTADDYDAGFNVLSAKAVPYGTVDGVPVMLHLTGRNTGGKAGTLQVGSSAPIALPKLAEFDSADVNADGVMTIARATADPIAAPTTWTLSNVTSSGILVRSYRPAGVGTAYQLVGIGAHNGSTRGYWSGAWAYALLRKDIAAADPSAPTDEEINAVMAELKIINQLDTPTLETVDCEITAHRGDAITLTGDYRKAVAQVVTATRYIDTITAEAAATQLTLTQDVYGRPLNNVRWYKICAGRPGSTGKITERFIPEGTAQISEAAKDIGVSGSIMAGDTIVIEGR